jgi:hypothetical protein
MIAHLGRFGYAESTLAKPALAKLALANLALAFTNKRPAVYTSIE